jgi:hypothetical protein
MGIKMSKLLGSNTKQRSSGRNKGVCKNGIHSTHVNNRVVMMCPACNTRFKDDKLYKEHWREKHTGATK